MILFGGYSDGGRAKSDVWLLNMDRTGTDMWKNMTPTSEGRIKPSPRFGHSSVLIGDELIIYGGVSMSSGNATADCLSDMWAFSVSSRTWKQLIAPTNDVLLRYSPRTFPPAPTPCTSFLLPYGYSKIMVWESLNPRPNKMWLMDLESMTRTDQVLNLHPTFPNGSIRVQAAGIWNGRLVYLAQNSSDDKLHGFIVLEIGEQCRPGFAQVQGPLEPCTHCPVGQYSKTHLTVNECVKCPQGTTTNSTVENATSIEYCTCDTNYCAHGSCAVRGSGQNISGICQCSFGFKGNRCDHVDYTVLTLSFGLLAITIIVVAAFSWCSIKTARYRRARKQSEWELTQTHRAFTVLPKEIELECRLDENCPGGYGRVYRAKYRDWTVAVKQLQLVMAEWPDIRREFLREIQFMRTVRHPNIVMFIGAGHYDENHLFLVLEFMSGGALRSLLENATVELTTKDQLQFIFDTAEGMAYLHTLKPPRIHRDLKFCNSCVGDHNKKDSFHWP
jgi:hypothetical protein